MSWWRSLPRVAMPTFPASSALLPNILLARFFIYPRFHEDLSGRVSVESKGKHFRKKNQPWILLARARRFDVNTKSFSFFFLLFVPKWRTKGNKANRLNSLERNKNLQYMRFVWRRQRLVKQNMQIKKSNIALHIRISNKHCWIRCEEIINV